MTAGDERAAELVAKTLADYAAGYAAHCVRFTQGDPHAAEEALQRVADRDGVLKDAISLIGRSFLIREALDAMKNGGDHDHSQDQDREEKGSGEDDTAPPYSANPDEG